MSFSTNAFIYSVSLIPCPFRKYELLQLIWLRFRDTLYVYVRRDMQDKDEKKA